jgi:hypothetical protein
VYAADEASPFHSACLCWLERQRARSDAWFATWPIVYEFLRVTTHPRVMRKPWNAGAAWGFVTSALFAAPGFEILAPTQRHVSVAGEVFGEMPHLAGNIMHDTHTAIILREHGIRHICTRDTDFCLFKFLEIIDPLAA